MSFSPWSHVCTLQQTVTSNDAMMIRESKLLTWLEWLNGSMLFTWDGGKVFRFVVHGPEDTRAEPCTRVVV